MKKYLAVLIVALLVVGISVTAYGQGMMGNFAGRMSVTQSGDRYERMLQKQANILGITMEELKTQLASGKTFPDLAKEKGIEFPAMRNRMFRSEERLTRGAFILGITVDELKKEQESGKTILEIAKDRGITVEQLHAKMLEFEKVRLQELVKTGNITQEEADKRQEAMKLRLEKVSCTTCDQDSELPNGFKGKFNLPNP